MTNIQKTMVVIGASGGMGSSLVTYLLEKNYKVIGWGRKESTINNENYQHYICNLSNPQQVEQEAKEILKCYEKIDGLILAAGYGAFNELEQFSLAKMQDLMNVNFLSQAVIVKILLPAIKKTKQGKIIAIASEAGLAGARKGSMYCASKFAMRGFMQSLRAECVQSAVAVTTINPGLVNTKFFENLRFKPGDEQCNVIEPEQIVKTLALVLQMENNCVFEEINLQPLKKVIQKH